MRKQVSAAAPTIPLIRMMRERMGKPSVEGTGFKPVPTLPDNTMTVRFWGVRGSIPSPGPSTARYGGNTSCVSVERGENKILILDAETGIRELGKALAESDTEIYVLLTHDHWDHIQGFPFFIPLQQPNRKILLLPTYQEKQKLCSLTAQMDGIHFPVISEGLPSHVEYVTEYEMFFLREHGFNISRIATNHPGGCYGYRLEHHGCSVVYIPDNELDPPDAKVTEFAEFVQFCEHADVLIHDAQYLEQDMPQKRGWGHSLVSQACELAQAAAVKHLILFHHDPDRADNELDAIEAAARAWFKKNHPEIQCTAAFEGLTLDIEKTVDVPDLMGDWLHSNRPWGHINTPIFQN
jgi:phosphoribosyl 1,2-cyclic phosphodiesterase